jgi:Tol biopolymer transport system component/DNA-binding winged helix-turn-helix (wHTH) protein
MVYKNGGSPFQLEEWIVEPAFNQLTHGKSRQRVEPKVMSVLLCLASKPQTVVSKDEILKSVWPDTFVGEDTLPRCISILRHIFADDLHNPHFIQTIPRIGYSLRVEPISIENPGRYVNRMNAIRVGAVVLAVIAAVGLSYLAVHLLRSTKTPPSFQVSELTISAGEQSNPALSPDGKRVAFVWAKEDGSPAQIYIKEIGREPIQRLTSLADSEFSPVWSPDGTEVAFLSSSDAGLGLYIASLPPSNSLRKVYIPGETTRWDRGALSWSPDGKSFALVDHIGSQPSSTIYLIDLETLNARPLTTPPTGWEGDLCPLFSPDGQKIAFVRASESWVADLYWIPASGGEPRRITSDGKLIDGFSWSPDGRSIIFSSTRAGQPALWKVSIDGSSMQRLPVGTENA